MNSISNFRTGDTIMKVTPLAIPDVLLLEADVYGDDRGFFLETWSAAESRRHGLDVDFVQDNWSRSSRGVLRGLHYQTEHTQGKMVRVVSGEVFDVAVDVRRSSPTFGRWVGQILSEKNKLALWVPPGFAHGFLTLSEVADFQYKCSDIYDPSSEQTIRWDDPTIAIDWPIEADTVIRLSEKDSSRGVAIDDSPCISWHSDPHSEEKRD